MKFFNGVLNAVLIAVAALSLLIAPPQALAQQPLKRLPLLIGADWNDNDSAAEKQLFYEAGCNFVRLGGGGYGWSLSGHERSLSDFHQHGVYAMLNLGSHWPDGSYVQYTDDYLIDDQGKTGVANKQQGFVDYDGSDWPQYSYASKEFRAHLQVDFGAYLRAVGSDPNVVQVQLHNEPGYHWVPGRVFDYNPKAIAAFKLWLPTQYSDVSALNTAWGTTYASFADAEPAHQRPPVANIAEWMDWRRFNADLIAQFLAWESGFSKSICPNLPTLTNLPGPLDNWYALRLSDNYRFTAPLDGAGIDIYATNWSNRYFVDYAMDTTRGAAVDKPITVNECGPYPATDFPSLSDEQRADRLRSDLWRYIGHGARAMSMWTLNDLTSGEYNGRIKAVREVTSLSKMLHLEDFTSAKRKVAVVVDQDAFIYYGGLIADRDGGIRCQKSVEGLYEALISSGYAVDIISTNQVRAGVDPRYRALALATPVITDASLTKGLSSFVARGGLVIAEAPFSELDRCGKAVPPTLNGTQKLFGISDLSPYDDGAPVTISGLNINGKGRQEVRTVGARVLAAFDDGSPAVTVNTSGKGKAVFIATDVGVINADGGQDALVKFLAANILGNESLKPVVSVTSSSFVDSMIENDSRGNGIVVLADTADKKEALAPQTDLDVSLSLSAVPTGSQIFLIAPTISDGVRSTAGPQPGPSPDRSGGLVKITVPECDSADILVIAKNFTPLLTISAPVQATSGSTIDVHVTCYNPSPKSFSGAVSLILPSGWESVGPQHAAVIAPHGKTEIVLSAHVGATEGRSVIKAVLSAPAGIDPVTSIPLDVIVSDGAAG